MAPHAEHLLLQLRHLHRSALLSDRLLKETSAEAGLFQIVRKIFASGVRQWRPLRVAGARGLEGCSRSAGLALPTGAFFEAPRRRGRLRTRALRRLLPRAVQLCSA